MSLIPIQTLDRAATHASSQAPVSPQLPAAPSRPGAIVQGPNGTSARVYSAQDVSALNARKNELSKQINSAHNRRKEVQEELRKATTPADRAGLEQRLGVLDARIARLEQDIDENSGQLASQAAQLAFTTGSPGHYWLPAGTNANSGRGFPAEVVALFVLFPLALAIARNIWKRGARPVAAPRNDDTTQRLERIEQAMDAIAIEVERVSEGQRFVTRLMAEGRPALGVGEPAIAPLRVADTSLVERP